MKADLFIAYAMTYVGIPYRWGGSYRDEGFDCSGFMQTLLAAVNLDPFGDQTAQDLRAHFKDNGRVVPREQAGLGDLVFYGPVTTIATHVGMGLGFGMLIEAAGGGPHDSVKAMRPESMVRMRPINYRDDFLDVVRPNGMGFAD